MLAFIDESGDAGLKVGQGSSPYFSVALVIFEEHEEAINCDRRIELLKAEIGKGRDFEFHFSKNSSRIRTQFLRAVSPYNFFYLVFGLNKSSSHLYGQGFQNKESLYKWTCGTLFENAKPYLNNAIIVIDKSGGTTFRSELGKYLKRRTEDHSEGCYTKKVRMQDSKMNNLLQLAEYVAGVINRKIQGKRDWMDFYRFLSMKEIEVRSWPPDS